MITTGTCDHAVSLVTHMLAAVNLHVFRAILLTQCTNTHNE